MGIFNRKSPPPLNKNNPGKNAKNNQENDEKQLESSETNEHSDHSNLEDGYDGGFNEEFGGGFDDIKERNSEIDKAKPFHSDNISDESSMQSSSSISHNDTIVEDTSNDNTYTFDPDRSYFFIFGPRSTGKSVLLMSLYRYLKTQRIGDSIRNINRPTVAHEHRGNKLINEFDSNINEKVFPLGTAGVDSSGLPAHLNFKFIPRQDLNKPSFEFCLMDMAGEDLARIDFQSTRGLPESIRTYIEDLPQRNLRFIYIIDPAEKFANKTSQIQLFNAFINLIDIYEHSNTPILLLVSKWDTVSSQYSSVQDYIKNEYAEIWSEISDVTRNFDYGKYSIGTVVSDDIFERIDFTYPKNLFNWIYFQHTGEDLDSDVNSSSAKKQSWWDRIIGNFFN